MRPSARHKNSAKRSNIENSTICAHVRANATTNIAEFMSENDDATLKRNTNAHTRVLNPHMHTNSGNVTPPSLKHSNNKNENNDVNVCNDEVLSPDMVLTSALFERRVTEDLSYIECNNAVDENLLLNPDAPPFCPTLSLNKHLYTGKNSFNKNILWCNVPYSPVFVPISIFCLILAYGIFLSLLCVNSRCNFLNKNIKSTMKDVCPNNLVI